MYITFGVEKGSFCFFPLVKRFKISIFPYAGFLTAKNARRCN